MTQPATTAPDVNTDLLRSYVAENGAHPNDMLILCDAVDTLRRQFAAQQTYINAMERRWNAAPHGDYCTRTKNTPCDCWKAS